MLDLRANDGGVAETPTLLTVTKKQHRGRAVTDKPDGNKAKAEEYENLADATVDPEEKKKLKDLARIARNLAPDPGTG